MKKVYRLPPCPSNDVERMESWLSDMALDGLILVEDGFFGGFATFERAQSKQLRYRLNASPFPSNLFNDYDAPSEAEVSISADMGWEYVCRRGSFYIYRTDDPNAPELNTDPQIQALTLQTLQKQQRRDLLFSLFWPILYTLLRMIPYGKPGLLMLSIGLGSGLFLLAAAVFLLLFLSPIISIVRLEKLRRKLKTTGDLDHRKDWRNGAVRYKLVSGVKGLALLICCVGLCGVRFQHSAGTNEVALADYEGSIPFATIEDLVDGSYSTDSRIIPSTIVQWSDLLAPVNIDFQERAIVTMDNGTKWDASLFADYHETVSPGLAQHLAEEYHRYYQTGDYELLAAPAVNADYAVAFRDDYHFTHIILRQDNNVLHALLSQYGDHTLSLDEWAAVLAESLKD